MKKKNEPKIRIVMMVFIALMVTSAFSSGVSGQVEASGLSFGTQVGEYNGVIAYSNYENDYVSNEYNYVEDYNTGMKWQCVEYVNRYYYITYGMEIRIPGTNAEDYYGTASDRGLIAYPNGGTTSPQPGDVLCSDGGTHGHVAIVREVTADSVHVIHQNWANTAADNDKIISMSVSDGHYTVSGFSGSYPVQGWLRKEIEAIYVPDDYPTIQAAVNAANAGDTIIVRDGMYTENVDVNKRLTIQSENGSDSTIVQDANPDDHVFEVTADYVNISGFTVTGAIGDWTAGIYLYDANYSNISNNNMWSNNGYGIWLYVSSNNNITNNKCLNNHGGILLSSSGNNTLENNNCSNNDYGICLAWSGNNRIENNKCNSNNYYGIHHYSSSNSIITGNTFEKCGITIYGYSIEYTNTHTVENNMVNGKPIYYYKNTEGIIVPEDAGQVIIANCSNMVVKNINASSASIGIDLAYTINSIIENNTCSNNKRGVDLLSSSNNNITNNICNSNFGGIDLYYSNNNYIKKNNCLNCWSSIILSEANNNLVSNNNCSNSSLGGINLGSSNNNSISNNICLNNHEGIKLGNSNNNCISNNNCSNIRWIGISFLNSNNNNIYLNNFMNNRYNVYFPDSTNIWNSTSKITYVYKGKTFANYLGNYWDDYTDVDADNDGIWDNHYPIDSDKDYHPLVEPFENYTTPLSPEKMLTVPFFSQRDPAWKDKKLDHSPYTIGGYGCALTSVAMVTKYFGYDTDPDRLNTSLTEVGGLDIYGILHWDKVEKVTGGKVKWMGWAGASWERIDQELSERNPVIANVSYPTTGYPYHFIVFIGKIDDKYYFLDPYDEQKEIIEWPNGKLGKYTLKNFRIYHGTSSITITAYSPVNIVVTDPDNLTISKQSNEIPGASYTEDDINGDEDPDDIIFIPYRKTGKYLISLSPEAGASPDDKYTLVVSTETANTTLAENVPVSEIPTEPYVFESTFYFDTGSPANPYPSIFGTHNGTITLNQTIPVQKLYTYPCTGTGGHTEYARIWNSTLDVNATWNGYAGDWHNITFNKSFTLVTNETYNYTIRTGSYPQIHHTPELPTTNGWINCTGFIDANGKRYNNWVPAIRVW